MSTLIPASVSEIVTDTQYAGMTQVVNIHTRTILVTDDGKYLRPDECALIDSRSIKMREAIEHGHLLVLNVIEAQPVSESSSRKKKSAPAPVEESTPADEVEPTETTSGEQPPAEEVAPEQPEESL